MLNVALARRLREQAGLTQEEVAVRIGVDQGTVANWELGHRTPQLRLLTAWANVLGVEPGELFQKGGEVKTQATGP
jgi:transcriptional regulator with XRE-family HTH domain